MGAGRLGRAIIAAVAVMTATAAFVACDNGGSSRNARVASNSRYVRPKLPPDIVLRQNARTIETRVLRWLGPKSRILSVTVVPREADIVEVIRSYGFSGPSSARDGPAWVVRAHGLFQTLVPEAGQRPLTSPRPG